MPTETQLSSNRCFTWVSIVVLALAAGCGDDQDDNDNGDDCECDTTSACCDGCSFINQGGDCSDGLFCNGTETCTAGVCGNSTGDPCPGPDGDDNCAESCNEATDSCNGNDADASACSDGLFCNGTETCTAGVCGSSSGSPCPGPDGDDNCNESCDETGDDCDGYDGDGAICESDGNACSVESCTGGTCAIDDPCPVFVDADAAGANDGSSWTNALTSIQAGVDLAAATSNPRVFVASGTYVGSAADVLVMAEGVSVYGSFAGTEDRVDQRATPAPRSSVLDGQDARRVVRGASNARLDGFTVQNGIATLGGGMHNEAVSNLMVAECTFTGNDAGPAAIAGGGGMYTLNSTLTITDVTFDGNGVSGVDGRGAGLYSDASTMTLSEAVFSNNAASGSGQSHGAGVFVRGGNATFEGCLFADNGAESAALAAGGGLSGENAQQVMLSDVRFAGNSVDGGTDGYGGAIELTGTAAATLSDVRLDGNSAVAIVNAHGGGLYVSGGTTEVTDGRFSGNEADGGTEGVGGGLYGVSATSITVSDVTFVDNEANGNGVDFFGVGGMYVADTTAVVENASFSSNLGGGFGATGGATADVRFSSFSHNDFSGIWNAGASVTVTSSAIFGHTADYSEPVTPVLIAFTNTCAQMDLTSYDASNVVIASDPFAVAASGDLFLNQASTCRDIGSIAAADSVYGADVWRGMTTDLAGVVLEATSTVDAGAHHDPTRSWIKTFVADATSVTWTTNAPPGGSCTVTAPGFAYVVPDADRASGTTSHALGAGVAFMLDCLDAAGHRNTATTGGPT